MRSAGVGRDERALPGAFVPAPRGELVTVVLDGEAVIFDGARQVVHALNATGTLVWNGADGSTTLDQLVAWLAEAHTVGADDVRGEVMAMVRDLIDNELLHGDGDADARPVPTPKRATAT